MPTSLMTVSAQLQQIGYDVELYDENLDVYSGNSTTIGINLLGAPYIPVVQNMFNRFSTENIFLGGQVINGLTDFQFRQLFGKALPGKMLGELSSVYKTSLVSIYEQIPDAQMKLYLEREFSFFVSQGCKFACKFCAAVRTQKDIVTKKVTRIAEQYRDLEILQIDLDYLVRRAETLSVEKVQIYLSNLDVFQTPSKLNAFAEIIIEARKKFPHIGFNLRGLATVDSFLECLHKFPFVIEKLIQAGYSTTGFGIDGGTPEVWRKIGKTHNFSKRDSDPGQKSLDAIRLSKELGITPEILMVFGHPDVDTEDSLKIAVDFTQDMMLRYGAVPRPHIAKNLVPGNDHWLDPKNTKQVKLFLDNPWLFQTLDFCALATWYTHGSQKFANIVNKYYLQICKLQGNITLPIIPIEFNGKVVTEKTVKKMLEENKNNFDG